AEIGERFALLVIAGDTDRAQAIGVSTPKLVERDVESLADRIPQHAIDTGLRAHRQLAVAQDVVAGLPHQLPTAFDVESVLPDEQRLDFIEDDLDDFGLSFELVAVVNLADDPLRRIDPGDDCAAVSHKVV